MVMVVDDLPEDALIEILARLPVESLVRFLCVCKSWHALIKSPSFITTHFNYASSNDNASRIVVIDPKYHNYDPYTTTVLSNDGVEIYHDLPNSFLLDIDKNLFPQTYLPRIQLSSPCNGVICVCDYKGAVAKRVALWNPAIREVNCLLLDDGIVNDIVYEEVSTLIGFGLDTKSNVYKVVRCREFKLLLDQYSVVDIYDVVNNNNGTWRILDDTDLPMTGYQGGSSVYADGFCYWPIFFTCDFRFILSFDFINDVFERISTPPGATDMVCPSMATFGESVAFVGLSLDHDCAIVWVLSREGDKKTWIKQYSLPSEYGLFPRFLRSDKVVILVGGDQLVLYDPISQELTKLMDFLGIYSTEHMNYVESLVSFKKYFPPYQKQQISPSSQSQFVEDA